MSKIKLLSLIIPAYKQEKTIVVFPMFVILDLIQNRLIKDLFLAIHIVLLVLLTALFTQEYLVA